MSCLYIASPPLVKEMGSCDYRGSWLSGHGLIFKGLGNGGFRFNSHNRKRLKNNFMHAHWMLSYPFFVTYGVTQHSVCLIYKLTFAIMKTQYVLSLFIYVLSLPPHDNLLSGKIINFVTWKHHMLCRVFLSHPKSKLVPTLPSRFPYGLFIHEQKESLKKLESKLEYNF